MSDQIEELGGSGGGEEASLEDLHQYVTFKVGGEVFAAPTAPVQEIIRVPDAVRVPLAPAHLLGFANLRGHVLPIVSLRQLFNLPDIENDELTRAVVIDLGTPMGFVVDCVASVISIEPDQLEPSESLSEGGRSDLVSGVIKGSGAELILLVDFARLIERAFADIHRATDGALGDGAHRGDTGETDEDALSDEMQLVSFVVESQEYAIPIASVQEIVQAPDHAIRVPDGPAALVGIMTLRNRLLPLVSLRHLFALPHRDLSPSDRVVVVNLNEVSVGLVMDRVSEVLRVPREFVDDMPPIMARGGQSDITAICRLGQGARLVSVIAPERLFSAAVLDRLSKQQANPEEQDMAQTGAGESGNADESQVVVFRLGAAEFGVPIDSVQEIVRVPDALTRVPKSPKFVEGVINLRGSVLAVIDQRRCFGLESIERSDRQRIMVYLLNGTRTGFIVDSVAEVMKIPHNAIEDSPRLSAEQARLIRRVANLQQSNRLVMMIEPDQLLETRELAALQELAA
ncbi:MAG: chemotaxis protein CheW [Rhodocyclaceae bacterium]|nr:chemotaxis protein CheW [Rhodocyclaceae bacterium]